MVTKRKPYKTFTKEFKLEAVRLMKESDRPARKIALELGVRRNQLYKWAEQLEDKGEAAFKGKGRPKKIESCFVLPHILKPTAQSVIASLK